MHSVFGDEEAHPIVYEIFCFVLKVNICKVILYGEDAFLCVVCTVSATCNNVCLNKQFAVFVSKKLLLADAYLDICTAPVAELVLFGVGDTLLANVAVCKSVK